MTAFEQQFLLFECVKIVTDTTVYYYLYILKNILYLHSLCSEILIQQDKILT